MATDIKLEIVKSGLKSLEVARLTGISVSRLSLLNNGWAEPRPDELERLRRVLPRIKARNE